MTPTTSAQSSVAVERRVVLHTMGNALHERLCGTPPTCGESWRKCRAAGIRHEDIAAAMTGLRRAGFKVVKDA